ncbi:MAG: glycosyltransferase [Flavobacteriia bacterium]|nr:glycosyltransferase [Flavobacteriia bacterium]
MAIQRLKILALCSWYPNDFNPTLGNFVKKHAEAASLYNDVVSLSVFPSSLDEKIRLVETRTRTFSEIVVYYPKTTSKFHLWNMFRNYFAHRKAFKKGYKTVKSIIGKPDLIHLNITYPLGIWAFYLKWRKDIPYVITENATGLHVGTDHSYPKIILSLCKFIVRRASILLPVSEDLKSYMQILSPKSQFAIISNVVDEEIFKYSEKQKELKTKTFIHISTGKDEHKNISGILSCISSISKYRKDFHLKIVSDGDVGYAKEKIEVLGIQDSVTFYSTKSTKEIASMIDNSSALLLFSNYENFPCVIAESLMMGKPVISTDVNGIPEHVNSKNGILIPKGDEAQLEKAICDFLDAKFTFDSNEIHSYAFKHFSYQEVGKQFDEQYRIVLNSKTQ